MEDSPQDWSWLRTATPARVALGAPGEPLPTREMLDFQLAHALARDAVHASLDTVALQLELRQQGLAAVLLHSAAPDRGIYLCRPDLGRALDEPSRQRLASSVPQEDYDAVFVLADGLSAVALQRHAIPLLRLTLERLRDDAWNIAPPVIVEQARVAIGDEIGAALGAKLAVVFIGERPGMSSPDSLGVYLTWRPRPGRTDAERNCISNIRPEGLAYAQAAHRLHFLMTESRRRKLSGVALKEDAPALEPPRQLP